jgi:FkbM family methyltransferase
LNSNLNAFIVQSSIWRKSYLFEIELKANTIKIESRKKSSDFEVIKQIFEDQEYLLPIQKIIASTLVSEQPIIVDAGANIGASGLYFITHFSNAILFCLEPFPASRHQLQKNFLRNNVKAEILPIALWSKNELVDFKRSFRDKKDWSVQTIESKNGQTRGIPLEMLFKELKIENIDILKIDIEGSEFDFFLTKKENLAYLKNIKSIILEIHDDAGNRKELVETLKSEGFSHFEYRELSLFTNNRYSL